MHHFIDRIAHTTTYVVPVVEYLLAGTRNSSVGPPTADVLPWKYIFTLSLWSSVGSWCEAVVCTVLSVGSLATVETKQPEYVIQ